LFVVVLASGLYILPFVNKGWVPHDEGLLGQSAERLLAGQLPHRDFDEVYTGGLNYLHALAFKLGGVRLISLRYVLLAFFLAWVPAVFAIACRFARPPMAAFVTILCIVWSVPNYFASMPSWYNTFFATFGIAALLKYVETGRPRWLIAAGAAGGVSCTIKSTAVYYIAGAILFLLTRELIESSGATTVRRVQAAIALKIGIALMVPAAIVLLVWSQWGLPAFAHFVMPIVLVVVLTVWLEAAWGSRATPGRIRRGARLIAPFILGAALPVAAFALLYALSGSADDLWQGVFVTPQRRVAVASSPLPPSEMLLRLIPYAAVLLVSSSGTRQPRALLWLEGALIVVLGVLLATSTSLVSYRILWNFSRQLNIVAALAGVWVLFRVLRSKWPPSQAEQGLLLLVCVMAFESLIEFPFAASIYFCYTAPFVVLALFAAIQVQQPNIAARRFHFVVAVALMVFAVARLNPGGVWAIGFEYQPYRVVNAAMPRVRLRIGEGDRADYATVLGLINAHAQGRYLYATPDCPELYFLSGLQNPTRTFYEAFNRDPLTADAVLDLVNRHDINVVVVNLRPEFSGPIDPEIDQALAARFPHAATVGRFMVRWSS
jgi:hypothetical protein